MTADRELGRRLADLFADEAPRLAPDWILPSALTTIESTRQRRGLVALRRLPLMPTYAKLGAATAAIVAVVAIAAWQLNANNVAHPTSTPSPAPSTVPSAGPGFSAIAYRLPALTSTFTSDVYGLTISYPTGWGTLPGSRAWTPTATYEEPQGDFLYDPLRENLFLKLASQPLGATSFDQWSKDVFAGRGCSGSTVPVSIDGVHGAVNTAENCLTAVVESGGRRYMILAHWDAGLAELQPIDWGGFLEDVLATVKLEPQNAVDR